MRSYAVLAATTMMCFAAACEPPPPARTGMASAAPPASGEARGSLRRRGVDSIVLMPVARVGMLDGPPEYAFGKVTAAVARSDGDVFICDADDVSIRQYDGGGTYVRTVGGRGAGPREYASCSFLSLLGDSVLWVGDVHNGRFVGLGVQDDSAVDDAGVVIGGEHSNGRFVDVQGRFWWMRVSIDRARGVDHQRFVVTDRALRTLVEVPVPSRSFGDERPRAFALATAEGTYLSVAYDSLWAIAPTGTLLIADPHRYRVRRTPVASDSLSLQRSVPPVGYTSGERADWEAWRAFMDRRTPGHAPLPERKPILRDLRGDDRGRTWVQVHVVAERREIPPRSPGDQRPVLSWRERATFDLFDERGAFIGRLALPHGARLLTSRGDRVWVAEEGSSGETVIGIYRMVPAPG